MTLSKKAVGFSTSLAFAAAVFGCGGSSSNSGGSTPTPPSPPAPTLAPYATGAAADTYVIQNGPIMNPGFSGQIVEFATGAGPNATPIGTLTTDLQISAVASDQYGSIYVGGSPSSGNDKIEIFAAGATGSAAPTRSITIVSDYPPIDMAVDASGSLYTIDGSSAINVYSSAASGSATPSRSISGAATGIAYPLAIAVDSTGTIYTSVPLVGSSPAAILAFSPSANGNVAPTRIIATPANGLYYGLTTDASGNLYAAIQPLTSTSSFTSAIVEFGPTATGSATPLKTISGTNTSIASPLGVRSDAAGNLYVVNLSGTPSAGQTYAILQFSSSATGNVAPLSATTSTSYTNGRADLALR